MNKLATLGALAVLGATSATGALAVTYNITTTFYEPDTQPRNTFFVGTFDYNSATHAVTNLKGSLSESMTGDPDANPAVHPDYQMTWLTLSNQLTSWHDATLGGTLAATFKNAATTTFWGGGWTPADGIAVGGIYAGFPGSNPGNAYALIFVPDNPVAVLSQQQIDKLAYADCAPGGMMGAACMTGTSIDGYGAIGTMSGYPLSQTITVVAVPEPESYALLLAGLTFVGIAARRRIGR